MNSKLEVKIDAIKEMSIEELCEKFECKPKEICMGDYIARNTTDTVCPYKVILGFANFEGSDVVSLGKLEVVYGKKITENGFVYRDLSRNAIYSGINLKNSKITSLGNLRKVYGSISLNENIKSLGNLAFLGSNLYLNKTQLKRIDSELKIDGTLNIEDCQLTSLGKLQAVRVINISSNSLKDFGELEHVKKVDFIKPYNLRTKKWFEDNFVYHKGKFVRKDLLTEVEV